MQRRTKGWITIMSFAAAAVCWASFLAFGAEVDSDGFLHEAFPLIPLGWVFVFVGLFFGTLYAIAVYLGRSRAIDK